MHEGLAHSRKHRGALILALGIIGVTVCGFIGIVALWMADSDLAEMESGVMDPSGRRMTKAGLWLGVTSIGIAALGIAAFLISAILGM